MKKKSEECEKIKANQAKYSFPNNLMQLTTDCVLLYRHEGKNVIWKAHYWDEVSESESKRELGNYIKMDMKRSMV